MSTNQQLAKELNSAASALQHGRYSSAKRKVARVNSEVNPPPSTPNGFDQRWIDAINNVLEDRGSDLRIEDLMPRAWDLFLGPLVDAVEDENSKVSVPA